MEKENSEQWKARSKSWKNLSIVFKKIQSMQKIEFYQELF